MSKHIVLLIYTAHSKDMTWMHTDTKTSIRVNVNYIWVF